MSASGGSERPIYVVNEFASVRVRKVHTRNGERLEIAALTSGSERRIMLDALVLESLTWRSVLELGQGLRTPFGPVHGDDTLNEGISDGGPDGVVPGGSDAPGAGLPRTDGAGVNGRPR